MAINGGVLFLQQQKLIKILADGGFHSGEELAAKFAVTRTAVWKAITKLRSKGIAIESFPKKGYKLVDKIELLNKNLILNNFNLHSNKHSKCLHLEILNSVDSTNAYMQKKINCKPGLVVLAEEQLQGKGRNGRSWFSPYGKNIYMSLYWKFNENIPCFAALSLIVGITIAEVINNYLATKLKRLNIEVASNPVVQLKWPNDLYVGSNKLAGVLIETVREAEGPINAIIGIGINVKSLGNVIANATSVEQAMLDCVNDYYNFRPCFSQSNKHHYPESTIKNMLSRNELLGMMLQKLFINLGIFTTHGFVYFKKMWQELDLLYGREIILQVSSEKLYKGIMQGVDDFGGIILLLADGEIVKVYSAIKVWLV